MIEDATNQSVRLADGRRLAYALFGDPLGAPVFYLHGVLSSRLEAEVLADAARAARIRLIGVDRPGIGQSSPQRTRTHASFASDLRELADALGLERFGIIGLSAGGAYALTAARVLGPRVTSLAVCAGLAPPGIADRVRPLGIRWFLALTRRTGIFAWCVIALIVSLVRRRGASLFKQGAKHPWDRRPLEVPGIAEIIARSWIEGTRQGAHRVVQDVRIVLRHWDVDPGPLDCPVHIWHGARDTTVPPEAARVNASLVKNAQLHLLPEQGHNLLVETATEVLASFATTADCVSGTTDVRRGS